MFGKSDALGAASTDPRGANAMHNSNVLPIGTLIGDYSIVGLLGHGGFGMTYEARDQHLHSPVALKEYFPGELARRGPDYSVETRPDGAVGGYSWGLEKFEQEAKALAQLVHPNIVGINHLFRANGTAYIVLDLIHGSSLSQWLKTISRSITQQEADAILFPLIEALETVHRKGLMHRDVAPKNIMLSPEFTPILIDFGTVRQLVAQRSQTLYAVLTPGYAPVEQYVATGVQQGPWTDIYALAATIYEAIAGRKPPEAIDRSLDDKCVPLADIGSGRFRPEFLAAIDWGLRPLPKDRPQDVATWRDALSRGLYTAPPVHQTQATFTAAPAPKKTGWFGRN